ncbi:hypothetical protein JW979_16090 [bacterium]|nr:hypothetical protein [candidate division CSSED10-310 bacterium]
MKSFFIYLFMVITTVIVFTSISNAKDWDFRFGLQYWRPDWSYEKDIYEYQADTSNVYGPAGYIGYKNWGFGVNYFTGNFDVDVDFDVSSKKREDLDIYVTYRFLSYFNAILGYKLLDFEKVESFDYDLTTSVDGIAIGIAMGYPLAKTRAFVYGNAFFMPSLSGEESWKPAYSGLPSLTYDVDAKGYNAELGLGYLWAMMEDFSLSFKGGYRLQRFKYEYGSDFVLDADEKYDGLKFEVSAIW